MKLINSVQLVYRGTSLLWTAKCPDYRGVLISVVDLYTEVPFGTPENVLIIAVSLFRSVRIREVPLYDMY